MNKMGDTPPRTLPKNDDAFAFSITSRTSFTPDVTALSVKNGTSKVLAMIFANVVFPTPGGPHRMNEATRFCSIILRITAPSPTRCFCPMYSSSVCGRNLSANGCIPILFTFHCEVTHLHCTNTFFPSLIYTPFFVG